MMRIQNKDESAEDVNDRHVNMTDEHIRKG